jgi:hypothetical protein
MGVGAYIFSPRIKHNNGTVCDARAELRVYSLRPCSAVLVDSHASKATRGRCCFALKKGNKMGQTQINK